MQALLYFKGNINKHHITLSELKDDLIDKNIKNIVSILK